ncbi:hypothetical protein JCM3765_000912 [Sporobolomyces pararoseus]
MVKRTRTNEEETPQPIPRNRLDSTTWQTKRESESSDGSRKSSRLKYKDTASSSKSKRSKQTLTLPEPLSLEGSISEEVLLRCLSFLTAHDLTTVARVSSAWYRLAQDPQLWRSLYLRTYASASTRRQASNGVSINRSRPWKDLYKISTNWRNGTAKATTVFTNSVRKAVLAPAPTDMSLTGDLVDTTFTPSRVGTSIQETDTLLQVYRNYFFSAIRGQNCSDPSLDPPSINVSHTLPNGSSQTLSSFSSSKISTFYSSRPDFKPPLSITELRLDESVSSYTMSPSSINLSVFYSTGQFSIFEITLPTTSSPLESKEVFTSLSLSSSSSSTSIYNSLTTSSSSPFEYVSLARFYFPLLVTCSNFFTLRFYKLEHHHHSHHHDHDHEENTLLQVIESETPLRTSERWEPVVLSLEKLKPRKSSRSSRGSEKGRGGGEDFKVSLAYSQPVFPNDWTVGLQEFTIKILSASSSSSYSPSKPFEITTLQATTSSTISSESPLSSISTSSASTFYSNPFSSGGVGGALRRQSPITSIEYSRPFIVTSKTDNTIQVYRVFSSSSSSSRRKSRQGEREREGEEEENLMIKFEKTLFGHTARVGSIALTSNSNNNNSSSSSTSGGFGTTKIVSAGDDGSFKVWSIGAGGGGGKSLKRRRTGSQCDGEEGEEVEEEEEGVIDIYTTTSTNLKEEEETVEAEGGGKTEWQRMKKRRFEKEEGIIDSTTLGVEEDGGESMVRPERIQKILVDQDKIVVLGTSSTSRERIRVLRFD